MPYLSIIFSALIIVSSSVNAEQKVLELPGTDIFLFDVEVEKNGLVLRNGKNITQRKGYDNQPSFSPDGRSLLFVSQRDLYQTDIYEYDIKTQKIKALTHTPTQEYSPMYDQDGKTLTVVRDGSQPNQTVWRINPKNGEETWALNTHEPVGYYAWTTAGQAVIWARYAYSIYILRSKKQDSVFVMGNAAPSRPQLMPDQQHISFVHRQMNGEIWIKSLDPNTRAVMPLAPVLEQQIDYGWMSNGDMITGEASGLFRWRLGVSETWEKVGDLSAEGVKSIKRLGFSPDNRKVAIVAADAVNE